MVGPAFAEEDGGFGGSAIDTMILMEAFGKGLVVEPVSTVLMAGSALAHAGTTAQKEGHLAAIIGGEAQASLAYIEPQARFNLNHVVTRAVPDGSDWVINGFKGVVLGAPSADLLIVSARTDGDEQAEEGITLFIVPADGAGPGRNYPTIDGFRASEVTLSDVRVSAGSVLGEVGQGLATLQYAIDQGILGVGAEAVGAMEVLYKGTVEYCKMREQLASLLVSSKCYSIVWSTCSSNTNKPNHSPTWRPCALLRSTTANRVKHCRHSKFRWAKGVPSLVKTRFSSMVAWA